MKPTILPEHIELEAVIIFLRFAKTRLNPDEWNKLFEIYRIFSIGGIDDEQKGGKYGK